MNLLASFDPNRGSGRSCALLAVNLRDMRASVGPEGGWGRRTGAGGGRPRGSRSPAVNHQPFLTRSLLLGPAALGGGRRGLLGGAVLGAGLLAVGDAQAVEHAADDVVADARQIADAAAADQG